MRRSRWPILVAGLALVLAGCSSGGEESSGSVSAPPEPGTTAGRTDAPAPAAAEVLRAFVDAAAGGDVEGMWELLSMSSRERLGPTRDEFALERAPGFQRGLGSFGGTDYRVVLATRTDSGVGIAAIAGPRRRAGKDEFAAYAVALRRRGSSWRLELGAPVQLRQLAPARVTSETRPAIEFEIETAGTVDEAGLWLDGAPLAADATGTAGDVHVTARPDELVPGWHVLTILGRSGDQVAAGAAPFYVERGQGSTGPRDLPLA